MSEKTPLEIASEEITRLRGLLAAGLKAAEGAQVIANCYFGDQDADPWNNENYCRLADWIKAVINAQRFEFVKQIKARSSKQYRWIAWEESTNRLEIDGLFTAQDLRRLADWLDNPEHPVDPMSQIRVELSPL